MDVGALSFYLPRVARSKIRQAMARSHIRFGSLTNDGGGMGIFAIAFLIAYWGGVVWIGGKLLVTGKRVRQANLQREWDFGLSQCRPDASSRRRRP